MKVGYCSSNYPNKRNILGKIQDIHYVKVFDAYRTASYVPLFINKKIIKSQLFDVNDIYYSFNDFGLNQVDLMHFFNVVSFCKTPWVTTFETILPRFSRALTCHHGSDFDYSSLSQDSRIQRALTAMCGDSCKRLIALSECNLNIQKYFLSQFPKYRSEIEKKLTFLHPPQQQLILDYGRKRSFLNGPLNFLFVGSAFFRKGGKEIIDAFVEFRKGIYDEIKLTIVSSMEIDNYATQENNLDVAKAKCIIGENKEWINYYSYLPNEKVIELMRRAHVGLLPTYADTYGYSVLEFQASGCPVISTNVRALPEINNDKIGWVIKIPKNTLGEAIYTTQRSRKEIGEFIKRGILNALKEIVNDKEVIYQKGEAALNRIKVEHSPEIFSNTLHDIYISSVK